MNDYIFLAAAAFLAGFVNSIAGGGTFLTFPALVYTGVPIVAANATSAVAVLPGYLGGTIGFWKDLGVLDRKRLIRIVGLTALGGLGGALLLLTSSNRAFTAVVPFLLMISTLLFAFGGTIERRARTSRLGIKREGAFGTILVSVYGGYFNGGLGIVLLALFSMWGMRDINIMNGLKNGLSFIISFVSMITFAGAGIVSWPQALVMMVTSTAGGYVGARFGRMLPHRVVHVAIVLTGASMSIFFFARLVW